ncbi:restriction endonuclease subunit S [Vreelandella zhaodongensis]|uniref:restriction endonuclease subunit S n=1 Tax=Vreelandella zhaodongensis TaxID=1176240 RepID=UPI003EC13AF7
MTQHNNTWKEVQLGGHVDLLTGYPFKSKQFTQDDNDIRLLRGDNVAQGFLRWNDARRWPREEYEAYSSCHLQKGDVILAMDRPWISAGLKYAWIKDGDLPCLLVQRVARLRGTDGLLTDYLRYVIGSHDFTNHVLSIITGVNVPHISGRDIKAFRFKLPPEPVQERAVSILSTYDDLIENNTRRIEILEEMARRLYEEWFVHFRFPGHEEVSFKESELGKIPEGWEICHLEDAVALNPRTKVPKEGKKWFVPMGALSESSMVVGSLEKKAGNSGAKFQNADTLVARITPCLENGKTGFVDFLPEDQPTACGSTEFIVMRSISLCPEMVYLLARSSRFRDVAIKSMSGATGRQRVRVESLRELPVIQPDQDTLDAFQQFAAPCFKQIRTLARKNMNLRAQRDLLLPKLVSGEIDVSDIPMPDDKEVEAA